MPVIFLLVFVLIAGMWLGQYFENENSPVVTEQAVLIKKIGSTVVDANGAMNVTLMLQFDIGGATLQCPVNHRVYRQVREGMTGMLTHQGTRFQCFEADGVRIEK